MSTGGIPTTQTLICHDFFHPWDDGGTQAASAWLNGFSFVTPQAGGVVIATGKHMKKMLPLTRPYNAIYISDIIYFLYVP